MTGEIDHENFSANKTNRYQTLNSSVVLLKLSCSSVRIKTGVKNTWWLQHFDNNTVKITIQGKHFYETCAKLSEKSNSQFDMI